tara:strand:+ start:1305 stop:1628 length:324 start_codon:yes stop_codon:yes gene_type:complete
MNSSRLAVVKILKEDRSVMNIVSSSSFFYISSLFLAREAEKGQKEPSDDKKGACATRAFTTRRKVAQMTELERQKRELIPIESQVNIGGNLKKWKTLTNKEKAYGGL